MNKALFEQVMQLGPVDRMRLLEALYCSLERPDATVDELWGDEAERRLASHRDGRSTAVPVEQVSGAHS